MQDFNSMMVTVNSVFNSINSTVSEMKDGDRYQLKDLSSIISEKANVDIDSATTFVHWFAHNTNMGYVSRGKKGGFIRGSKPAKLHKKPSTDLVEQDLSDES